MDLSKDEVKCEAVTVPKRTDLVDGEACDTDNTCFKGLTCDATSKKCVGFAKDAKCTDVQQRECATGFSCQGTADAMTCKA